MDLAPPKVIDEVLLAPPYGLIRKRETSPLAWPSAGLRGVELVEPITGQLAKLAPC